MIRWLKYAFAFFASYGLAVVLMLFLLLLTFLGTIEQVNYGLYEVQKKYFESIVLTHTFFGVPLPLPGVYLLLILLCVNTVCGGVLRMRKNRQTFGVLIIHLGTIFLLFGGFITYRFAENGHMTLFEGQQSSEVQSYNEWEIAVARADGTNKTEWIIPGASIVNLAPGETRTFTAQQIPFALTLTSVYSNAQPTPKGPMFDTDQQVIDGFFLQPMPQQKENEQNIAGAYVSIRDKTTGTAQPVILWGASRYPLFVRASGATYTVDLRKQRTTVPFSITLDHFSRELHPRTEMAKSFMSDVTVNENGLSRKVRISMNEPLRYKGYTFYQASWGPSDAKPGEPLYSTFAVVRNPADQWPLYACIIATLGLVLHFGQRLMRYLRIQNLAAKSAGVTLAALVVACAVVGLPAHAQKPETSGGAVATATQPWNPMTLHLFGALPVQEQGRIKPLSTYAGFSLLKINGKRDVRVDGRTLTPMEWLLDTLFYPDTAKTYKVFIVQSAEVLDAMGLGHEGKKKRDRYSYAELMPGRDALYALARDYSVIPAQDRSLQQAQIVNLADNLLEYEGILHYLDFARTDYALGTTKGLKALFPEDSETPFSYILTKAGTLHAAMEMVDGAVTQGIDSQARAAEGEALHALIRRIDAAGSQANTLALFPPVGGMADTQEWLSPADILGFAFLSDKDMTEEIGLLQSLERLARAVDNREIFAQRARDLNHTLVGIAEQRGEYGHIALEDTYYRLQLLYWALVLYVLSFIIVAVSWMVPKQRWAYRLSRWAVMPPTVLLVAAIVLRCIIRGRPPVTTLYETILFVTAIATLTALVAEYINRQRIAVALSAFFGALGLFLAYKYEIKEGVDTMPSLVAVLNTNFWLATHVTTVTMGYGAGLLAAAVGHVYIVGRFLGIKRHHPAFYDAVTRMTYGVICFGLVFSVIGTVLGGVWANDSWGRFWGWDPKENGALMIVLWELALLHARRGGYLEQLGVNMAAVFGAIIIAFSWWGVNLLSVGLHSYGFTSGIRNMLIIFCAVEVFILTLGVTVWVRDRFLASAVARAR